MSAQDIMDYRNEINFIFKSLEFLDSSVLNLIPYEVVSCLDKALAEWTPTGQRFIIVTSLINNNDNFGFDPSLAQNEVFYSYLASKYNIVFEGRLVQINIPKNLSRDYLISGIHYHELGHFVDSKFSISNSVTQVLFTNLVRQLIPTSHIPHLVRFLPAIGWILQGNNPAEVFETCQKHIAEYLCDLFAAQYVGDCSANHLNYLTAGQGASYTHPITPLRLEVVNDFLSVRRNVIIDLLNMALNQIVNKQLEIRFEQVNSADFLEFLPPVIENDRQLHGIFAAGNQVWRSDWGAFGTKLDIENSLQSEKMYSIINNLIEKSIGNYIVVEKWNQMQAEQVGS